MKFTDGRWLLRPGVEAFHPVSVLSVDADQGALGVRAAVRPITKRGDLLKGPVVTLEFRAPMPDVIAVRVTHLAGEVQREPRFQLDVADVADVADGGGTVSAASLTSGALSARVSTTGEWRVEFRAGDRVLTASEPGATAVVTDADGTPYVREQLSLAVGDLVYGLGERFGPLVKNGQAVDIWNADGGTGSEQAYKNVPFALTNAGYGVFVNDPGKVSFEVASEAVSRLQFSVPGQSMEYFVIYGPSPKDILRR